MAQIRDEIFLIRLMAVELEAEFGQARLSELVVDDVERRELFGDKEHLFAVPETFRDNIGNRLALAGSRRALQDKALAGLGHLNRLHLTGVGVDDAVELGERIRESRVGRGVRLLLDRLAQERAHVPIGENRTRVVL